MKKIVKFQIVIPCLKVAFTAIFIFALLLMSDAAIPDPKALSLNEIVRETAYGYTEKIFGDEMSTVAGDESKYDETLKILQKEAQQEVGRSQYRLAFFYLKGIQVTQDTAKAIDLFKSALKNGVDEAALILATYYLFETSEDHSHAQIYINRALEKKFPTAKTLLAICHIDGIGVQKDLDKAFNLLNEAIGEGCVWAPHQLGLFYKQGLIVSQNHTLNYELQLHSAKSGFSHAQHELALCYAYGTGVSQDFKIAFEWFEKAALQGYAHAQHSLANAYLNGRGCTLDFLKAREWFEKSSSQGISESPAALAVIYLQTESPLHDIPKGMAYLKQAVELRNPLGQYMHGALYLGADNILPKDISKGLELLEASAKQGYPPALVKLGQLHLNREIAGASLQKAYLYFYLAQQVAPDPAVNQNLQILKEQMSLIELANAGKDISDFKFVKEGNSEGTEYNHFFKREPEKINK